MEASLDKNLYRNWWNLYQEYERINSLFYHTWIQKLGKHITFMDLIQNHLSIPQFGEMFLALSTLFHKIIAVSMQYGLPSRKYFILSSLRMYYQDKNQMDRLKKKEWKELEKWEKDQWKLLEVYQSLYRYRWMGSIFGIYWVHY